MSQTDSEDGISTANTNVSVVADNRLQYADHERMVLIKGVQDSRDLTVMVNRVIEEHGDVTGVETVSKPSVSNPGVSIIYCDNY